MLFFFILNFADVTCFVMSKKAKGKSAAPAAAAGHGNIPDTVIAKLLDRKNFSFYKGK